MDKGYVGQIPTKLEYLDRQEFEIMKDVNRTFIVSSIFASFVELDMIPKILSSLKVSQ